MKLHKNKNMLWGKPFKKAMDVLRARQKELEENDFRDEIKRQRHRLKGT